MSKKRKKSGSMAHQAKEALRAIFLLDTRVTEASLSRAGFPGRGIGTISTMRAYTKKVCAFAKWCRERYGVRNVRYITPEMAVEYLHVQCDNESPQGSIDVVAAALRKLDVAMRVEGYWSQDAPALLAGSKERLS